MSVREHRLFRALAALALLSLLVPMVFSLSACTAIGFAIGSAGDQDEARRILPASDLLAVRPGTRMVFEVERGQPLDGIYLGPARVNDEAYRMMWEVWLVAHRGPALGDTVQVEGEGGAITGVFDGFGFRSIELRASGDTLPRRLPFRSFRTLRARDWSLSSDALELMQTRGDLPMRDALRIGAPSPRKGEPAEWGGPSRREPWAPTDTVLVAFGDVRRVLMPAGQNGAMIGMVVGLAIDVIVVTSLMRAPKPQPMSCEPSPGWPGLFSAAPRLVTPLEHDWDLLAGCELAAHDDDAVAATGVRP